MQRQPDGLNMGREGRKEGGIKGGGKKERERRKELVLKSVRLNEVTCVGRKGTEPGSLLVTSGSNIWVTGNVSGEVKIRIWV